MIEIRRARREFEVGSKTSILGNNVEPFLLGVEGRVGGARLVSIHMLPPVPRGDAGLACGKGKECPLGLERDCSAQRGPSRRQLN